MKPQLEASKLDSYMDCASSPAIRADCKHYSIFLISQIAMLKIPSNSKVLELYNFTGPLVSVGLESDCIVVFGKVA